MCHTENLRGKIQQFPTLYWDDQESLKATHLTPKTVKTTPKPNNISPVPDHSQKKKKKKGLAERTGDGGTQPP